MTELSKHTRKAVSANAATIAASMSMGNSALARQRNHQLKHFMQPGTDSLLPVSTARHGFSLAQYQQAHRLFSPAHYQMGGDDALIYNSKLNEFLPSSMVKPLSVNNALPREINEQIAMLSCKSTGGMTQSLSEYIAKPASRIQGVMIVQSGTIVFDDYPGMDPDDKHVWMELSRNTVGMVFSQFISEGIVALDKSISVYLPELLGTDWDLVSVRDALCHKTGLNVTHNIQTLFDPKSNIARFLAAEFGQAVSNAAPKEHWLDVVKQIERVPGTKAGECTSHSAITVAVLTYMAERIDNAPWTILFQTRVWGHIKAKAPMLVSLAPDGSAISHGLTLSTLEDAARFAMLFTPSWKSIAVKPGLPLQWLQAFSRPLQPAKFKSTDVFQVNKVFEDGARYLRGAFGQGMYVDTKRDFVAVYFSSQDSAYGDEDNAMMRYFRLASKL
ncbi:MULTISPECIES: serine hydrolase domain-containing protein [unclassified Agarivorans]|uniref:serine hydrolase domain-containing protein n=1 Tax=unclassified Agarivorans TaxID=2636026 RepID=UPI0026E14DE7|nr:MULTISPECIES: serine hydrolase domain-containing protein [unclassified Agarivorans]MDO6686051.1 serine hydrolase domain-containing protein [Agarivorans sp. 3_MG-2023]MDO6713811.1 serine hydrolase domain-containing protein [Agarivorans sp. 2_MG-2023]